jgi:aspartate/methionine/tyrosine aminotransferase
MRRASAQSRLISRLTPVNPPLQKSFCEDLPTLQQNLAQTLCNLEQHFCRRYKQVVKTPNKLLSESGTTIFTTMSALAVQHNAINLGQGFPDTDGPADIIAAAAAALTQNHNQYPPMAGVAELRHAVAEANQRFYGLEIDPLTGVLVTSGATEALAASLMALINPGDEVVLIEPLYDTYLPIITLLGGTPRIVRLNPPDWTLPREDFAAAFNQRTKLLLLNSPMNPTGKVFSPEDLIFIAKTLLAHDCYAICDEVYEHLVFTPAKHLPLMTLPGMATRCLRIGSAGKTFSLTGWKIGYISGPPALISVAAKAHQNLTFTTPPNLQRAIAYGLAKPDEYFAALAESLQSQRDILATGLTRLGFKTLATDGSYFITADFSPLGLHLDDVTFCRTITEHAGVAAIPVSAFYATNPPTHYARFAFCKQPSVLRQAVSRLESWLTALKKLTAPA